MHPLLGDEGLVGMPEMVRGTAVEDGDVQSVSAGCSKDLRGSGVWDIGHQERCGWPCGDRLSEGCGESWAMSRDYGSHVGDRGGTEFEDTLSCILDGGRRSRVTTNDG